MNKINVLYQNLNFQSAAYSVNDNLDTPIFASDETLTDLLKKASLSKYDPYRKGHKNMSNTKITNSFQNHPEYINDSSLVSVTDIPAIAEKRRLDNLVRKVTFMNEEKKEPSETSFVTRVPSSKIINTNLTSPENTYEDLKKLEMEEINNRTSKKMDIKEEHILGVKLKSYLIKICAWMQEIRATIQSGIAPIEGFEDYCRRERRASEFASRFSRNYLYQLSRQLIELRRHTQKPSQASRPGAPSAARSLTNACQTVLQAVQAYCNYIPTTISITGSGRSTNRSGESVHAKFCELLTDTCDLCRVVKKLGCIYYDVGSSLSLVEDIDTNCKSLLSLVQNMLMKRDEPAPKPSKQAERKKAVQKDKNNTSFNKKDPLETRLSMYSVAFKKNQKTNPNWKKNAEKLAKQKLSVQSRYKNPKQQPTSEAPAPLPEQKQKSLAEKRVLVHNSGSRSQISTELVKINEDDIQTMVAMENKKLEDNNGDIRSRLEPLLKSLVAEVAAGKEVGEANHKDDLLGQGVCEDMLLKLRGLLNQVQHPLSMPDKMDRLDPGPQTHITVTGARNAKLICIKDKSLFESKTEVKTLKPYYENGQVPKSLSFLPALERNLSRKKLDKSQAIANLSKQYTINIVQYKIDFHKYTKPLMMYRKSSQVLPWILTSKVTDSLFENLLFSVMSEINIDGLAEQIYRAEFET